jgi:hypothetical protein
MDRTGRTLIERCVMIVWAIVLSLLLATSIAYSMGCTIRRETYQARGLDWVNENNGSSHVHISGQRWDVNAQQYWTARVSQYLAAHPAIAPSVATSLRSFVVEPGMTQAQVTVIWGEPRQRKPSPKGECWQYWDHTPQWGYDLHFNRNGGLDRILRATSDVP